ncbi:cleavage and polyadenylation specificity factor subunit 2 [Nematocida sp. ERTm5]|nr:cleavage and polyadenylation specificity factor subunit 2 [Nematocida sp. ERTm5]
MEDGITAVHVPRNTPLESCCTIVEIDNLRILVNFGTEYDLSLDIYSDLEYLKGITHIILCSSDISSLGGLIHLESLGIDVPIYGTVPIKILGRIEILERIKVLEKFHSIGSSEAKQDRVFDKIIPLKYTQTVELSDGIFVGPLNSGSSVGGSVWKIRKNEQEWLICDKVNHRKEAHLDGLDTSNISKPLGIVVNSTHVIKEQNTRRMRDKELVDCIVKCINNKGKVFIPTGYSQLLEIVMTLYNHKDTQELTMALYSFYGSKYFDMVKTILEWTGSSILQKFNQEKENPFNLLNLKFYNECADCEIPEDIIFVIDKHGNSGFSPVILPGIAKNPQNLILKMSDSLQYKERADSIRAEEGGSTEVKNSNDASLSDAISDDKSISKEASSDCNQVSKKARQYQYSHSIVLSPIKYARLSTTEIETEYKKSKKEQDEQEAQKKIDSLVKQKIEDSSEEEEDRKQIFNRFWHELQDEIETMEENITYLDFDIKCAGSELLFPNPAKRKPTDDYGEPVSIQKDKEEEKEVEVIMKPEVIQKKAFRISIRKKQTIEIYAQIKTLLFTSESDIFNLKIVLSGIGSEKIVVYGEDPILRKVLKEYFTCTKTSMQVLELFDRQKLEGIRHTVPLKIRNDALSHIQVQKLGNTLIGYFKAKVQSAEKIPILEIDGMENIGESICVGTAKLSELRQIFIDEKIKADVVDNKLIISDEISIYFDKQKLILEGDISKELYQVKKILSQSIACLHSE